MWQNPAKQQATASIWLFPEASVSHLQMFYMSRIIISYFQKCSSSVKTNTNRFISKSHVSASTANTFTCECSGFISIIVFIWWNDGQPLQYKFSNYIVPIISYLLLIWQHINVCRTTKAAWMWFMNNWFLFFFLTNAPFLLLLHEQTGYVLG